MGTNYKNLKSEDDTLTKRFRGDDFCKKCGAEIKWCRLVNNRYVAVEPEPVIYMPNYDLNIVKDEIQRLIERKQYGDLTGREIQQINQTIWKLRDIKHNWICEKQWDSDLYSDALIYRSGYIDLGIFDNKKAVRGFELHVFNCMR